MLFLLNAMNYFIDPYGYQSRDKKFIKNLTMFNKPNVTNARISSDGYYYLIGSSRIARVSPKLIETITSKKTHNIKIDGATLSENALLASKVKEKGSFFIYSLDAFSSNKSREEFKEIKNRYKTYKDELKSSTFFSKYYNSDITIRSLQHLIKTLRGENIDKQYFQENFRDSSFLISQVFNDSGILNNTKKGNFANFVSYSEDSIINLAKLGDQEDIFIILPKYLAYYSLFSEYQDIENKYFSVIRTLVHNTDAQVWSFYGNNRITKNINNFIDNGWHFKPQVSNIIFRTVFANNLQVPSEQYGVLITKDNLESYLESISNSIRVSSVDYM